MTHAETIQDLSDATGCSKIECKDTFRACGYDYDKTVSRLRCPMNRINPWYERIEKLEERLDDLERMA